jgi:hypothetical protein
LNLLLLFGPRNNTKCISEAAMGATNRSVSIVTVNDPCASAAAVGPVDLPRTPALRVAPLLQPTLPRRFMRVPTHAIGVVPDHREYPRATLKLPLRLRGVAGVPEKFPITLVTRDISSTGVYFLSPKQLPVGASIELEIVLVSRPRGGGNVLMATRAQVRRVDAAAMPNWYGIAASFDDLQFGRDDGVRCDYR